MAAGEHNAAHAHRPHILVVPYPAQGHVNPMLQFSKRLRHKGAAVTFAITTFLSKSNHAAAHLPFPVETISDGYDDGGYLSAESIHAYHERFERVGAQTLRDLLRRLASAGRPVHCVVYDGFMPWALDVAKELNLKGALYFTQSCAVDCIYYHVYGGGIEVPLPEEIVVGGLPALRRCDMPSLVCDVRSYPGFTAVVMDQFRNVGEADYVVCNSFYELEKEVIEWLGRIWEIKTVGPNVPSTYMDGRIQHDTEYGFSLFNTDGGACVKWLDALPKGSVVYVAFGSFAALSAEQMEELASGLRRINSHFLWVVRSSEEGKLPKNFAEETAEKGKVVSWCPQLEVLSHDAVGCFVTHCGWNSTLEALSLGVPMVAMPQWTDQSTNAKFVMDVWKMGIRAPADDGGVVRGETVAECIGEIMEGERGKEIKTTAAKWGALAKRAVDEGGTSDRNIDEILAKLGLALK